MSKTAEWLREKFVDRLEQEFFDKNGRWPNSAEETVLWEEAFRLAKLEELQLG